MKISVWDTYVAREDGKTMHFDILVPNTMEDKDSIFNYGREFLSTKPFKTAGLSSKECQFCHMEQAGHIIKEGINEKGYFIIEMENCQ
ncbi:DUF2024 domain-containing protein [Arenibacter sp. TNZ]|jgi:hypothetical protein|uniref:DUF2024 family protein n=1 Tax=Arenibacter TaxID=178469 RepID=UPI000CD457A1|nr:MULTISPECIES: DUF2024 family protein [Arenibacter]MCM4170337.1 DUF2024 domain-containing protein [Arenibacter sp. TNZ]